MDIILCVLNMHYIWVDIKAAYIEKVVAFHFALFSGFFLSFQGF